MTATMISLIGVTFGFAALVAWVYWPSRRHRLEELGRIPLEGNDEEEIEDE
jgi:cbb3-type cytochrome oxidase subunit 3